MTNRDIFDIGLIRSYPQANKKIPLAAKPYDVTFPNIEVADEMNGHTTFISPFGIEFQGFEDYPEGTLLKINLSLPDYWNRKQRFVQYGRVDVPSELKILAKVVKTEDLGKRGKKKLVVAQTVNIDEIDELVLKSYLQEAK